MARIRVTSSVLMMLVVALLVATSLASVVLYQTYDNPPNSVGSLPVGWTNVPGFGAQSGPAPGAIVQNGIAFTPADPASNPSPPNVFQNSHTNQDYILETAFTPFTLDAASNNLSYEYDLRVDELPTTPVAGAIGFKTKIWNNNSFIEVGDYRIVSLAANTFTFYNDNYLANGTTPYIGSFAQDEWHNVKVVIDPISASAGTSQLIVNDVVIATEIYSGKGPGTTANMSRFWLQSQNSSATTLTSTIYIDNLVIATPEPTGIAAILALSGFALMRRRNS